MPDHLTLYDGDLYNRTVQPIVKIRVDPNNDDERYLHKTAKSNAMSVKFHATGSRDSLGFVAEVVTLPMSVVGLNRYGHKFSSFGCFLHFWLSEDSFYWSYPIFVVQRIDRLW